MALFLCSTTPACDRPDDPRRRWVHQEAVLTRPATTRPTRRRSMPDPSRRGWRRWGALRGADAPVPCDGSRPASSSQFVHIAPDEADTLDHVPRSSCSRFRRPRGHVLMGYDEHGNARARRRYVLDLRAPPASTAPTLPRLCHWRVLTMQGRDRAPSSTLALHLRERRRPDRRDAVRGRDVRAWSRRRVPGRCIAPNRDERAVARSNCTARLGVEEETGGESSSNRCAQQFATPSPLDRRLPLRGERGRRGSRRAARALARQLAVEDARQGVPRGLRHGVHDELVGACATRLWVAGSGLLRRRPRSVLRRRRGRR